MGLQPRGNRLQVGIGGPKLLAVLLGREPLVIVGRRLVLLIVEQLAERSLLVRAVLQHQQHPRHGQTRRSCAQIVFRPRQRMRIAL